MAKLRAAQAPVSFIVYAISAVAALYTRQKVTPVADPKDGNGQPLAPVPPPTAGVTVNVTAGNPGDVGKAVVKAIADYGKNAPPGPAMPPPAEPPQ